MHNALKWAATIGALMLTMVSTTSGERQKDARDLLVGDWKGQSICTALLPACHDEEVVYHIKKASNDESKVILKADKIVNGELEIMAVLEFKYDPLNRTLMSEFDNGR